MLDPQKTPISKVMSKDVLAIPASTTLRDATAADAARIMVDEGIHRVLVMDGKKILGIVTALDLVPLLADRAPSRARSRS